MAATAVQRARLMLQPGRKASTGADANGPRDLPMAGACVREKLQRIGRQCVAMGCCSAAAIETAGGGEGGSRDDEWRRGRRVHGMVRAAAEDFLHECEGSTSFSSLVVRASRATCLGLSFSLSTATPLHTLCIPSLKCVSFLITENRV